MATKDVKPQTLLDSTENAARSQRFVTLSERKRQLFADGLKEDLARARRDRIAFDESLVKWERQYEAVPEIETKTFPWKNASNIVAPITAINVDALAARVEGELVGRRDIVQIKSIRSDIPDLDDTADAISRYLNHAARQHNDLDTERCLQDLIPDAILNGISFIKVPYVYEESEVPQFIGGTVSYKKTITHNGPKHVWVSAADMLWPEGTFDIQRCRWLAQRFYLESWQLKQRANDPLYGYDASASERILKELSREVPVAIQESFSVQGFSFESFERAEMYEVYVFADLETKNEYLPYIVTIHPESSTIVKIVKNFYAHRLRPFVPFFYSKRRKSIVGIGVGQMLERLQDGITTSINQMVDNSTAANTVVLKVKKNAIKAGEEIYPMKKLFVDDMEDLEQFRLGENATGMMNAISIMRNFAELRTSVTDYFLGTESSTIGSRATAAGTLSLIQEGNKQIDKFVRMFRSAMNDVWALTIPTYQQFTPTRKIVGVLGAEADKVIKDLSFPEDWFFDKFNVTAEQTSSSANREIEKQNAITLFNMLQGYYEKIVDVSMVYNNPQIPPVTKAAIEKGINALNELLERILRTFETYNVEEFKIVFAELEKQIGGLNGIGNIPGAAGGSGGVVPGEGLQGAGLMVPGVPGGGGEGMLEQEGIPGGNPL